MRDLLARDPPRLEHQATGDWLLFVDTDVRLDPRAWGVAMVAAQEQGACMAPRACSWRRCGPRPSSRSPPR